MINYYSGLTGSDRAKLDSISSIVKNNLGAVAAPTASDDESKGYSVGSVWIYSGVTYSCADITTNNAIWTDSNAEVYFDDWAALVTAISVTGTTYVNKYAHIANANGGPSSGLSYVAPGAIPDYIVDGGAAVFKVNAQGTNYSVSCLTRSITNPVVTSVMLTAAAKPTTKGYYIFSITPIDGLPTGISLNDVAYFDGTTWACWQKYSAATAVLVAGTTTNTQVTWRKFNGRWMSTADDYIPDGLEYQTGKLWNSKPVYRKCFSGNLNGQSTQSVSATGAIPLTGTILLVLGTYYRGTGTVVTVYTTLSFAVNIQGTLIASNSDTAGNSGNFTCWVEYTKN